MKFVLKPSLEQMTLVKIVISLWNQNDVRALISKLYCWDLYSNEKWNSIEERVIKKVPHLSLPQLLKANVLGVIKPIGLELLEWIRYYCQYDGRMDYDEWIILDCQNLDLPAHLPAELCWTPQGTVDREKTAQVLVRNENLKVSKRYRLSCDYCLEDDIIRFWNRLPQDVKDYDWSDYPVISFWSDNMKRGRVGPISYKDVFDSSVHMSNNKVAATYFLQKLTPQEREESLKLVAIYREVAHVLCFLLPKMEEEEQIKVLKNNPYMLHCFLEWPWQSFFIGVANCMWDFLSKENYKGILGDIIAKVRYGYKDYNYQNLFGEFWQKSPSALKDSFINEIDKNSWIIQCLFEIKDKESILLILKDTSFITREKLIYNYQIVDYLTDLAWDNKWDLLEFCIRACLPSKDEMLKFKEEFEKRSPYTKKHLAKNKHSWSQIFCFSDDSICKYNKRSVEVGESSSNTY